MEIPKPLTETEATFLRRQFGPNVISTHRAVTWYSILVLALFHPFNILLAILATATALSDDFAGMCVMIIMILTSFSIRFTQEYKSARAAQSLRRLVMHTVRVVRLGVRENETSITQPTTATELPIEDLVPGDWIELAAGSLVPADIQLIKSKDLLVSQSSLTGEAIPVEKYAPDHLPPPNWLKKGVVKSDLSLSISMDDDDLQLLSGDRPSCRQRCSNLLRAMFGLRVERKFGSLIRADLDNPALCYMGTSVVSGTGTAIVLRTGPSTYFGSMAKQLAKAQPQNAFQLGVRRISWIFFLTMLCLIPPVLLLQGFLNSDWNGAFLFSLAVAVGLTPEMLPVIVSATLARGAFVMSRKKCIVKNMDSIINLGGMDVLCTDKTGTLTENCVSLTAHVDFRGQSSVLTGRLGFLNSFFQSGLDNVMDEAVVACFQETAAATAAGFRKVDEIPFDFLRRRMSVVLSSDSDVHEPWLLVSKGAVDEMLSICSNLYLAPPPPTASSNSEPARPANLSGSQSVFDLPDQSECPPLTSEFRAELQRLNSSFNEDGLRVVAVAFKRMARVGEDGAQSLLNKSDETEMTFAGFLVFQDPPKQCTAAALKTLMEHNVKVKVLTGDSAAVCRKVCQEIQLPVRRVVESWELEGASETEIGALAESGTIFSKLTPLQKADIVRALKRADHVVGFLGDGINDAPALAEADIGISVDNGTEIARDAANIILLEKDLGVVADGVLEGRTTYGNTMKYIVMAVSSNFGNVFSVLVASAWLPFVPMLPIHILAQNLLYDTSQIAIPWDNMDREFLTVPHRWSMRSVLTFMVFIGPWSSIFDICTFLFMYYYHGVQSADNDHDVLLFQTAWFTVGLLTQTLIVHMIRTPRIPFVQSIAALPLLCTTVLIMGVGLALPYIPGVSTYLDFVHLDWTVYVFTALVLLAYCSAAQLAKFAYIKIFRKWY